MGPPAVRFPLAAVFRRAWRYFATPVPTILPVLRARDPMRDRRSAPQASPRGPRRSGGFSPSIGGGWIRSIPPPRLSPPASMEGSGGGPSTGGAPWASPPGGCRWGASHRLPSHAACIGGPETGASPRPAMILGTGSDPTPAYTGLRNHQPYRRGMVPWKTSSPMVW